MASEDLSSEAGIVTKEIVHTFLFRDSEPDTQFITDMKIEPATKPGENLLSKIFKVTVSSQSKNGARQSHHLIIKTNVSSTDSGDLTNFIEQEKYFFKESMTYAEILPAIETYERRQGIPPLPENPFANLVGYILNEKHSMIAMNDLTQEGYQKVDFNRGLDHHHCKIALQALARFHSIGYALKSGSLSSLRENFPYIFTNNFISDAMFQRLQPVFVQNRACVIQVVKQSNLSDELKSHVKNLEDFDILSVCNRTTTPEVPYATICLRDCTHRNMLFRYDVKSKSPVAVKLVDFQHVQYTSPMTDIANFLLLCVPYIFEGDNLHEFLRIYHNHLQQELDRLNTGLTFTFDELYDNFLRTRGHGISNGIHALPFMLMKQEDLPEGVLVHPDSPILPELMSRAIMGNDRNAARFLGMYKWAIQDGLI